MVPFSLLLEMMCERWYREETTPTPSSSSFLFAWRPSLGFYSCSITREEALNCSSPRGGNVGKGGIVDEEPEKGSVPPALP